MDFITTWYSIKMLFTKKLTNYVLFVNFFTCSISFDQKKYATTQYTSLK